MFSKAVTATTTCLGSTLLCALLCAFAGCGTRAKPPTDLVVTSYSPNETSTRSQPVELRFDQPVVGDAQVGAALAEIPVRIEPAVEVSAHWLDRQTLVVTPKQDMLRSTRYRVTLTGDLGRRTDRFSFSFVHEPLVVEGIWGVDMNQLPVAPELPLHFNQAVAVADVIKHCRLQAQGMSIELKAADGAEDGEQVVVVPAAVLEQDRDYSLTCEKLAGRGGNEPMATSYLQGLHTYAPFVVREALPAGEDAPADDVEITFTFATPVELDAVRDALRAKPNISGLNQGWLDRAGTQYKVVANLDTLTEYEVTLAAGIRDIFGQTLAAPYTIRFTTGSARPRLSLETGIYALEAGSAGYPVWTRNVRDFDVECAVVPKSKVVTVLTSAMDYDPWYDAGGDEIDWKELGLARKDKRVTIPDAKDNWHLSNLAMHEVCGSGKERGLYLADLHSQHIKPDDEYSWRYRPHRRVLANVTNLGILLKAGTGSGLVWVAQISDGAPVDGAAVTIYSPQGKQVFRGTTDKDGILRIPGTTELLKQPGADDKDELEDEDEDEEDYYDEDEYASYRSQRLIAVVEKGDDLGVMDGNWANGIQTWNFGVRPERQSGKTRIRGFIQSDRGIYRPGETVYFKGLVREIAVGRAPAVPKSSKIEIAVEDSRGQNVLQKSMKLSKFGGFAFDLPLTESANLGDYHVTATIMGQVFREKFSVEEFRKVSYEVDLKGAERHGRIGDKLRFVVDANYLFGAPVVDAEVEWNVQRRDHNVYFPKYGEYAFGDYASRGYWYYYGYYDRDEYLSYVSDGSGETDDKGRMEFAVRDPRTNFDGPQDYVVGVSVRDETDQVVGKRVVVTAHRSDFYLGLHTQEFVQAVDMPFAINAVALSPAGETVATKATLKFIRETYTCTDSGGYRSYRSCRTGHEVELERTIDIPAGGVATERIMPKKPGEYVIRIEAKDSRGNEVAASGNVWIIGKGEAFWSGDESARMSLVTSKASYEPGDTARLVPRTGMKNATALVTVERDGIIDAYVKPVADAGEGIEIAVKDTHAPNVFASVALVTGRTGEGDKNRPQFKVGITELKVSSAGKRLEVAVETDKDTYQPGETVQGVVRVTAEGQPVSAEVSVSVADEGVLQLIGYKTPDPMASFYASWGLGVDNSTNWNRIARLNDPEIGDPDMGGDSDDSGGEPEVRSNFVSSAFWAPSLVTDDKGEVRFSFTAPDNLTAFRTMAVAADVGSRFGSSDRRFTIKKPLMAKPVLPRFLSTGDEAEVGVVVHNYTGEAGTAAVAMKAKGVRVKGGTEKSVKLEKDGIARVSFAVTGGTSKEAEFEFSVAMGAHRDALVLPLPLNQPLIVETRTVASGIAGRDGAETLKVPVSWDKTLVASRSVLSISADRTGLGDLEPSLRYLIEYPYGCLEQTLSRFVPLTKVKDLAESLNMESLEGPKMEGFLRAGVAKVARHQHANGHFSLWPSSETEPHLTVYALYGLTEAKRAGVKVPEDTITRGVRAMQDWVGKQQIGPGGDSGTMGMAAYVLAELGQADAGLNDRLFAGRRALPYYGQAFLLRAMKRGGARAEDVSALKSELVAAVTGTGEVAVLKETMPDLAYYMSSDVRTSAIFLSALLEVDAKHALVDKLVEGLKQSRKSSGRWYNTQENLYALVALSDYARAATAGSDLVTVSINGKQELKRRLSGAKVLLLRRYLHNYEPGEVIIETSGKVRYDVRLIEARDDPGAAAVSEGFAITRSYVDPKTGVPVTEFKTGQLIKVRLEVTSPERRNYVAVEDPLPAGFEAVNTRLATSADTGGAEANSSWAWSHQELRDDRVLAFANRMYRSSMVLEYLARATMPGSFVAAPARVEEMYSPDVHGRSVGTRVVIAK